MINVSETLKLTDFISRTTIYSIKTVYQFDKNDEDQNHRNVINKLLFYFYV